jgi:hypothetical protein
LSQAEVDEFFDQYVFTFIAGDVQREIDLARSGGPAANFVCALGLLCYTEVLGGVKRGTLGRGQAKKNFDSFFASMGTPYAALLSKVDIYGVFRCGMAHEYFVKGEATVAMLKGVEPAGIAQDTATGRYYFVVERYFEDFIAAARALRAHLLAQPQPSLPPELAGRF